MSRTAVTKPAPEDHEWGEAIAGGDVATPSDGLKGTGYNTNPTIPKRTHFNYFLRKFDRAVRYLISRGLPDWDAAETYQVGDIVRYTVSGVTYFLVAVVTPTVGVNPLTNINTSARQWEQWLYSNLGSPSADATATPVTRWMNNRGISGSEVDHLGYIGGTFALTEYETWRGADNLSGSASTTFLNTKLQWGVGTVLGGFVQVLAPSAAAVVRNVSLLIVGNATDEAAMESQVLGRFQDQLMFETSLLMGASVDQQVCAFGIADRSVETYGITNAFIGCIFRKANADTNWQAICGDGSARTIVDTGVAASVNSTPSMRIEFQGASFNDGANAVVRFYLNGAKVATTTTHLPSSAGSLNATVVLKTKRDTGTASREIRVKPVRFATNIS